ncbi:MAG: transcription antitermination factor NusB [Clostridia bacterium]|nr:transcription antitermination factor NusB [Clostridia bacterium]
MRKQARECAVKLIYEYQFWQKPNGSTLDTLIENHKLDEKDIAYLQTVYEGVIAHWDELREEILSRSEKYKAERMFLLDLSIMMLALYEMRYCADIPNKVSLNEAIEISKEYSTDKSGAIINGILANYL